MAERSSTFYLGVGCGTLGLFTLLCLGCGGGIYEGIHAYLVRTPVVQGAIGAVQADAGAAERLGAPVEVGWWFQGTLSTNDKGGHADLILPVSGPLDEATLAIVATDEGDGWHYETLNLVFANGGGALDLIASIPDNPDVARVNKVTRLLDEAEALAGEGKFPEAIARCDEALAEAPDDVRGLTVRGRTKADAGDFAGAKVDLVRVGEIDPVNVPSRLRLGLVYTNLGDLKGCVDTFTEALRLDSRSGEAWLGRAICYETQGELRQAVAGARQACDLSLPAGCEMAARLEPNRR